MMKSRGSAGRVTFSSLKRMKERKEKIASLTAYDATFARILDSAGIDMILVGDTLGVVIQGEDTTVSVTVSDMAYHCRCVTRTVKHALVVCDMPFMSYSNVADALKNATRLMREGGAHGVKLEAGEHQREILQALAGSGIPCCAHLGLRPQWIHKSGGYRLHAQDPTTAGQLLKEAQLLEKAGADMLLLECVSADVAGEVQKTVSVPVIGIGSGGSCDGQILVLYDAIGLSQPPLWFTEDFLSGHSSVASAINTYIEAVKSGSFPATKHAFRNRPGDATLS